jgi:hypothetical protein
MNVHDPNPKQRTRGVRRNQSVSQKLFWTTVGLAFLAIALTIYGRALGYPFSQVDDYNYVTNNPIIRSINLENLQSMFKLKFSGNYAPLHILAYALEYKAWELWAPGYHGVNVILHALNGVLVVTLCDRGRILSWVVHLLYPCRQEGLPMALHKTCP